MDESNLHFKLYENRGETSRFINIEITDKGDVLMSGQDLGKVVEDYWGDSDYEYWLHVDQEHKDLLLIALIRKMFEGSSDAFSKFRELLIEFTVPYQFDSWV